MAGILWAILVPLVGALASALPLPRPVRVGVAAVVGLLQWGAVLLLLEGTHQVAIPPLLTQAAGATSAMMDGTLLLYFMYVAWNRRSLPTGITTLLNLALFVLIEAAGFRQPVVFLRLDGLARFFLVVIALVAPAIWAWTPFYQQHYRTQVPRFAEGPYYFWLYAIVAVMNLLVTVNGLMDLYLLWELTTLASFLLIGSPRSPEAREASVRALWMNGAGGAAFLAGTLWYGLESGSLSLAHLASGHQAEPAVALLAVAAAVKAAQFPVTRWLRDAMVAPAPVSALLHSSTMVKAGVYLALRLSPALYHSAAGYTLALAGGMTFLGAAALAAGSQNTKEVLAHSTISNLGLMLAMAGLGSPLAVAAALLLVAFHAVAKALLFLVAGTVESDLGSRRLEAAAGLVEVRPALGVLGMWGMLSLYLPPLGLLFGKWVALEAAAPALPLFVLLAVGSALTAFFWTKTVGRFAVAAATPPPSWQRLPGGAYAAMGLLAAEVAVGSVAVWPLWSLLASRVVVPLTGGSGAVSGVLGGAMPPWYGAIVLVFLLLLLFGLRPAAEGDRAVPYLAGEEVAALSPAGRTGSFRSTADVPVAAQLAGFYPPASLLVTIDGFFLVTGLLLLLLLVGVSL